MVAAAKAVEAWAEGKEKSFSQTVVGRALLTVFFNPKTTIDVIPKAMRK